MNEPKIPRNWLNWGSSNSKRHRKSVQRKRAILQCLKDGCVRGYFSDFILDPTLDRMDSMCPSIEHLNGTKDQEHVAVEVRVINEMKTHLSEKEFWQVVEHLFGVGVEKGKIRPPFGKRLPRGWKPDRQFRADTAKPAGASNGELPPPSCEGGE